METRGVVGHRVFDAGQEVVQRYVPMVPTVDGLDSEKVGRSGRSGGGALTLPEEGWSVVSARLESTFSDVKALDTSLVVEDTPSEFEIGVGYLSAGVGKGN